MAESKSSRSTDAASAAQQPSIHSVSAKSPEATGAARLLATTLAQFLSPRLTSDTRVCVALSGGCDSVVLLHALSQMATMENKAAFSSFTLSAIHVHHGLSPRADEWADFCSALCAQCGVPLQIAHVDVPRDSGEGIEGAARRVRHAVFAECAADYLALAHHRDDQAETVLLNLLRGAGVAGASAMWAERPQAQGPTLIRPLLDVPRQVIEAYALAHGLRWIDDESNSDSHFRRNFLRHEILPKLEEKFSGAKKSLARAARHFSEATSLLDDLAALDHAAVLATSGRMALGAFNQLPPARARNLLRFAWAKAGFRAPDSRWLDEALRQLASTTTISETCVATPEGELRAYRGELYLLALPVAAPSEAVLWHGEAELPWAGHALRFLPSVGRALSQKKLLGACVQLRVRQGGERLQLADNRPRRSLRNQLQDAAIPPWSRAALPLLWVDGQLAWVAGLGVDAHFACASDEEGVLPVWAGL